MTSDRLKQAFKYLGILTVALLLTTCGNIVGEKSLNTDVPEETALISTETPISTPTITPTPTLNPEQMDAIESFFFKSLDFIIYMN